MDGGGRTPVSVEDDNDVCMAKSFVIIDLVFCGLASVLLALKLPHGKTDFLRSVITTAFLVAVLIGVLKGKRGLIMFGVVIAALGCCADLMVMFDGESNKDRRVTSRGFLGLAIHLPEAIFLFKLYRLLGQGGN